MISHNIFWSSFTSSFPIFIWLTPASYPIYFQACSFFLFNNKQTNKTRQLRTNKKKTRKVKEKITEAHIYTQACTKLEPRGTESETTTYVQKESLKNAQTKQYETLSHKINGNTLSSFVIAFYCWEWGLPLEVVPIAKKLNWR